MMPQSDSESDYEEVEDRLSAADVDRTRQQLSDKCSAVNAYLLSSREPVDKRRLVESTIQDLLAAYNQIAANYLRVSAMINTALSIKSAIKNTVKQEIASAVQLAHTSPKTSYADAVAKSSSKHDVRKVRVTKGPTVVIPSTVSVVIGPKKETALKFSSANDTCKAIVTAVKPTEVGMKVNRMVHTRNNAVRIIADSLDLARLKESPSLAAAGLEVKERELLNPRLIIRDVPTDMSNDELAADIATLNLDADSKTTIKIVYRYPSRRAKDLASVVIEVNSEIRRQLLSRGRISLEWRSCKVEDYLRVLQCFKCHDFGHLAKNCTSNAFCGNCAGSHETSSCSSSVDHKCINCLRNKLSSIDHKAYDAAKCPIIKRKLTEKAKNIAY